jgi:putative NADH-flavin reductase
MKLLVIGAASGTGAALAEQAVREGHSVTALVRRPERMRAGAKGVRIV